MSKSKSDRDPWDRYFTAPKLAQRIVEWAGLERLDYQSVYDPPRILEPSAGSGALVKAARSWLISHNVIAHLTALDVLDEQVEALRRIDWNQGAYAGELDVQKADFTNWRTTSRFHLGLMNPPFSDGKDGLHVMHAARCCNRVVALVRTNFEHTARRWYDCMQWVRVTRKAVLVSRPPPFQGPGDLNQSPQSDYVVLDLERREKLREPGEVDQVAVEYWT